MLIEKEILYYFVDFLHLREFRYVFNTDERCLQGFGLYENFIEQKVADLQNKYPNELEITYEISKKSKIHTYSAKTAILTLKIHENVDLEAFYCLLKIT